MKEFFKGPAKRFYANIFMAMVLKKASRIITVSHFTESEILKHFKKLKVTRGKVHDFLGMMIKLLLGRNFYVKDSGNKLNKQ